MTNNTATLKSSKLPINKAHLLFSIILLGIFAFLYREALVHAFVRWNTLGSSHVPLIFAVFLYLIWMKRERLRALQAEPSIILGTLVLICGCFALFAGKISDTILIQQISMIPVLLGLALLLGGMPFFNVLLLPIGYLIFLTDLLDHVLSEVSIYLQQVTAWLSAMFLKLLGFSVFQDNIIIMLPHITLKVVPACNGANQIVALLALAVPLAFFTQNNVARKVFLVAMAPFIAIFVNGMRAAMIGIYALYNEGADLHGPAGTLSAAVIFFFGLVVLILFSLVLKSFGQRKDPGKGKEPPRNQPTSAKSARQRGSSGQRLLAFIAAAVILGGTLGFMHVHSVEYVALDHSLDRLPENMANFSAREIDSMDKRLRPFPADQELMRLYTDGQGNRLALYIGYFGMQEKNKEIIHYRRSWMHDDSATITVKGNTDTYMLNKTGMKASSSVAHVYFWYQMDKRMIRNEYVGKLFTFLNSFLYEKTNGAVVVMQARGAEERIRDFLEKAVPEIHALVAAR